MTDKFTYACLIYNLIFHLIFISALQKGISAENFKMNPVHINYLDFRISNFYAVICVRLSLALLRFFIVFV